MTTTATTTFIFCLTGLLSWRYFMFRLFPIAERGDCNRPEALPDAKHHKKYDSYNVILNINY